MQREQLLVECHAIRLHHVDDLFAIQPTADTVVRTNGKIHIFVRLRMDCRRCIGYGVFEFLVGVKHEAEVQWSGWCILPSEGLPLGGYDVWHLRRALST